MILVAYACLIQSQLDSFGMGTNENSKNIIISHDITSEERRRFERKMKK